MRLRTKLLSGILATLLLQIATTCTFTLVYFIGSTRTTLQAQLEADWSHARAYMEDLKHDLVTQLYQLTFFLGHDESAGATPDELRGLLRYFTSLTNADRIVLIDGSGVTVADQTAGVAAAADALPIAYLRPRDFLFPRTLFIAVKDPGSTTHLYLVSGAPVTGGPDGDSHIYLVTNIDAGFADAMREKIGTEVRFFVGFTPVIAGESWESPGKGEPLLSPTVRRGDTTYRLYAKAMKESSDAENSMRKAQVGSGQRGDKVRTYRFQDDRVVDHRVGKKIRLADVLAGDIDALR